MMYFSSFFFRANDRLLHNSGRDLSLQDVHLSLSKVKFKVLLNSPYRLHSITGSNLEVLCNAPYQFHLYLIRVFCQANCINEPSYWAPVVGNNIYADVSTCFCPWALQGWEMGNEAFVVKHLWGLKWACYSCGESRPRELSVWVLRELLVEVGSIVATNFSPRV